MKTITLHALSPKTPCSIDPLLIKDIIETRFGGCGILFTDRQLPVHFWESKEQVMEMMAPKA